MNSSRRSRIDRLVAVRARQLESAQTTLAAAHRAARSAEEARDAAEHAWLDRAVTLERAPAPTMDALVEARAHLDGLRRRADLAGIAALRARGVLASARNACLDADRELKKLQIWRDQLVEVERADEARRERLVTDEVAARVFARECA
jgi:hypothetical protein